MKIIIDFVSSPSSSSKPGSNYVWGGLYEFYLLQNAGIPCRVIEPSKGISKYVNVSAQKGCDDCHCWDKTGFPAAVHAARHADATILTVGLSVDCEAESLDRTDLRLPGFQTDLINEIVNASPKPVIMVILSAGGLDISFAKNNPKIGAILWAGYPGEEGGRAIADVIFGNYNPGMCLFETVGSCDGSSCYETKMKGW